MIPKVIKKRGQSGTCTADFRNIVSYICSKAECVETANLAGEWTSASWQMEIASSLNSRIEAPAYHFLLSWPELERPDDGQMIAAARHAVAELGGADRQHVIAVHRDRHHHHVHVVLNRVHSETGEAMRTSHDFARLERACRHIEAEQGWSRDRGRFDVEINDVGGSPAVQLVAKPAEHWQVVEKRRQQGLRPDSFAELKAEQKTGRRPLKDRLEGVKDELKAAIDAAGNWQALHEGLLPFGLDYRRHGSGARICSIETGDFLSPSHLGKRFGLNVLSGRIGPFEETPPRPPVPCDEQPAPAPSPPAEAGWQHFRAEAAELAARNTASKGRRTEERQALKASQQAEASQVREMTGNRRHPAAQALRLAVRQKHADETAALPDGRTVTRRVPPADYRAHMAAAGPAGSRKLRYRLPFREWAAAARGLAQRLMVSVAAELLGLERVTDCSAARQRWATASADGPGGAEAHGISAGTLGRFSDGVRTGLFGELLFAHRNGASIVGFEQHGQSGRFHFNGMASGSVKTVCVLGNPETASRAVVLEGGLDALSLAQLERREDTVYLATGGGFGRRTEAALIRLAAGKQVLAGFNAGQRGQEATDELRRIIPGTGRLAPPGGRNWHDVLTAQLRQEPETTEEEETDSPAPALTPSF